jgi:hypothetical protein
MDRRGPAKSDEIMDPHQERRKSFDEAKAELVHLLVRSHSGSSVGEICFDIRALEKESLLKEVVAEACSDLFPQLSTHQHLCRFKPICTNGIAHSGQ